MTKLQEQIFWSATFRRLGSGFLNQKKNELIAALDAYGVDTMNSNYSFWIALQHLTENDISSPNPIISVLGDEDGTLTDVENSWNKWLGFAPGSSDTVRSWDSGWENTYAMYVDVRFYDYPDNRTGTEYKIIPSISFPGAAIKYWILLNRTKIIELDPPEFFEELFKHMAIFVREDESSWDQFVGMIGELLGVISTQYDYAQISGGIDFGWSGALTLAGSLYTEKKTYDNLQELNKLMIEQQMLIEQLSAEQDINDSISVDMSDINGIDEDYNYDIEIEYTDEDHEYKYGVKPLEIDDVYTGKFKLK